MFAKLLSVLVLCLVASRVHGEQCVVDPSNYCVCSLADGRQLDLTPITYAATFKDFAGPYGNFRYAWGPCNHVLNKLTGYCNPGNDSAVCQDGYGKTSYWFNLGKISTAMFDVDTNANPTVTSLNYTGGTPVEPGKPRYSVFKLVCDPNSDPGSIREYNKEGEYASYYFEFHSKHACLTTAGSCPLVDQAKPCVCELQDHRYINLTKIQHTFERFMGDDGRLYAWGPCGNDLDLGEFCVPTNDPAMCQGDNGHWYSLGKSSTASFSVDLQSNPVTTTLSYTGGTDGRNTIVKLICDETAGVGRVLELYEEPALVYNFVFVSQYACPSMEKPCAKGQDIDLQDGSSTNVNLPAKCPYLYDTD